MPSLSIVGQILGCTGFDANRLFCKFRLETKAAGWSVVYGDPDGQTQLGIQTTDSEYDGQVFAHPIDVTYACSSLIGWPRLYIEVWEQDGFGRNQIAGYGSCFVPTTPGMHNLDCVTWRPEGSLYDSISAAFIGGNPTLVNPSIVTSSDDRLELNTVSQGSVHLDIQILLHGFQYKGVEFNTKQTPKNKSGTGPSDPSMPGVKQGDEDESMSVYLDTFIADD
tara:strand:- start:120 stop:785 length:666 start_codon:yes stop_codon:yes gene_type:complete